jgi:uncharacterized RDD family membrane protein YckC
MDIAILAVPWFCIMSGTYLTPVLYTREVCWALGIIYYVGFLSSRWQATPGMRLVRIYVAHADGSGRISAARAFARYLVFNALFLILILIPSLNPKLPINLSKANGQRYGAAEAKVSAGQPLTPEEQRLLAETREAMIAVRRSTMPNTLFEGIYMVIMAFMIGLTKHRTGLHDLVCSTRVMVGRPCSVGSTDSPH